MDEFQFWMDVSSSGSNSTEKERAAHFYSLFQPITKEIAGMESLPLEDALELPALTQDALDDLWKQTEFDRPYSEARMRHVMEVFGGYLLLQEICIWQEWHNVSHQV